MIPSKKFIKIKPKVNSKNSRNYNNSISSQRARLIKFLETNIRTTVREINKRLGIFSPTARVSELRKKGHRIDNIWIDELDDNFVMHRVVQYVYQGIRQEGA